jgi:LysR family transcriptional regulator, low CO2-responsive transcriptional regulator
MKNLTFKQLQAFCTLVECKSHADTAEMLGVTQPAVSMLIKQLEREAGLSLWQGYGRGRKYELSVAGQLVLRHARSALEQMRLLNEGLEHLASGSGGHIHLGVVPTANYWAPQLLMAFQRENPSITFKLSVGSRSQVLGWLKEHQIDLAIGGHPPGEAEVEALAFARHPHCIVAAASHPQAGLPRVSWASLREEPFIFREEGSATRSFFEHLIQGQALQVNARIELSGNETVKQAVIAGMGISFMSAHAIQIELKAGFMAVLNVVGMPKWLDWCLLSRHDSSPSKAASAFRQFVIAHGAQIASARSS